MRSDADVLRAFLQLFEWVFEVEFPPMHARAIEHEVRVGWANNDASERELVAYVLDTYALITRTPSAGRSKRRGEAKQIFAKMFAKIEPNDRGRVLAAIHRAVESLRPGASGVPIAGLSAPAGSSHAHLPQLAYSSGGAAPVPYATALPSTIGHPQPMGHPGQATAYPPPMMGYPPPSMGYPPQPMGYGPLHPWAIPQVQQPQDDPYVAAARSAQQQQLEMHERIQKITLESNKAAAMHGAMMTVIGNIK